MYPSPPTNSGRPPRTPATAERAGWFRSITRTVETAAPPDLVYRCFDRAATGGRRTWAGQELRITRDPKPLIRPGTRGYVVAPGHTLRIRAEPAGSGTTVTSTIGDMGNTVVGTAVGLGACLFFCPVVAFFIIATRHGWGGAAWAMAVGLAAFLLFVASSIIRTARRTMRQDAIWFDVVIHEAFRSIAVHHHDQHRWSERPGDGAAAPLPGPSVDELARRCHWTPASPADARQWFLTAASSEMMIAGGSPTTDSGAGPWDPTGGAPRPLHVRIELAEHGGSTIVLLPDSEPVRPGVDLVAPAMTNHRFLELMALMHAWVGPESP